VMRETRHYEPALVRAAQRERRLATERSRWSGRSWPAYPLLGLLPETPQRLLCERLGLLPERATALASLGELVAMAWVLGGGLDAGDPTGASLYTMLGGTLLLGPLAALTLLRGVAAVAFDTVSGSVLLTPLARLWVLAAAGVDRFDAGVVPLTRPAFWARLAQPDRQRREPDGALRVESDLPHLSWTRSPRVQSEGRAWLVETEPPRLESGRLIYAYRLSPLVEGEAALPPRDLYQREVMDVVASDWSDLLASGFGPIVSLLPAPEQQRALDARGGPAAIRRAARGSALAELLVGLWWASGGEVAMLAAGLALAADGVLRLRLVARGEYAPSLFGGMLGDLFRPERRPYHAHLAAERDALASLGTRN